jgi:hypothetical protein
MPFVGALYSALTINSQHHPMVYLAQSAGTFRTWRAVRLESVVRFKADIGGDEHRGLFKQAALNPGRPMAPASETS